MRFTIVLITAFAAFVLAAPAPKPEGASSENVGCKAEFDADDELYARCVGIEVRQSNNN